MSKSIHTISIIIYDRDTAFKAVTAILHDFASDILLRVGYPMKERNIAIIFLVTEMTNDKIGAISGKLGQIESVKVKSTSLKI